MNKTQKSAIFCLATFLFCITVIAYTFISIFIFKIWPPGFYGKYWSLIAYIAVVVASVTFLRKKQSPNEPDFDERDDLIKKRAVMVSFISVWILLASSCLILRFIVGISGTIAVWALTLIYLGVFIAAMLVYNVAVLIQYGWGGKRGEK